MYRFKPELRIPGPVPVPSEVSLQMARPVINHRGAVFKEKFPDVLSRLKLLFGTENTVYMVTGSGTAGMETAVSNLVSPGTPVLCLVGGFSVSAGLSCVQPTRQWCMSWSFPGIGASTQIRWPSFWPSIPKLS